jgi:two-component system, chemotaxis family, CheB/CheR fusion protein
MKGLILGLRYPAAGIHTGSRGKIPEANPERWCPITTGIGIANVLHMTRVLLVEDSDDVLCVLRMELEWAGYTVDAVTNATAALAAAQQTPPAVIVSDLGMPGMDGFEFIKCIRNIPGLARVPAIALTGAALDKDIEQALAFGFTVHMTKPVEAKELCMRIEQLTAKRLLRKAG